MGNVMCNGMGEMPGQEGRDSVFDESCHHTLPTPDETRCADCGTLLNEVEE